MDSTGPQGITRFNSASVYPDRLADELCSLSSSCVFLECVIKQKYYPRLFAWQCMRPIILGAAFVMFSGHIDDEPTVSVSHS